MTGMQEGHLPSIPKPVRKAHAEGKLAIFVGSGLSLGKDVAGNFPGWNGIATRLLDLCNEFERGEPDAIAALRATFHQSLRLEQLLTQLDSIKTLLDRDYQEALTRIFRPKDARSGAAHRHIVALKPSLIVTTNYDLLLEDADHQRARYTWKEAGKVKGDLKGGRAVLFKVHGTAEHAETVILTKGEYEALAREQGYQEVFKWLFQTYTFLFVGYGADDPLDLDQIMKISAAAFGPSAERHFVLCYNPKGSDSRGPFENRFERDYNISPLFYKDHEQLPAILQGIGTASPQVQPEVTPPPLVRPPLRRPEYKRSITDVQADELEDAYRRKRALEQAGASTAEVKKEIVELKRAMRQGGRLKAGDRLGDDRYLLLEQLGRGGFATVWKALDEDASRYVAIKVLHSELGGEEIRLERFFRGARIMEELSHEGVVRVLEAHGEDDGYYYFVMELMAGGNLHRAVLDGRVTAEMALPLILRIGEALGKAHNKGYVHRDVKPANILIGDTGAAKLTDFDLVAAADTTGGTRTGAMGTLIYAAPELLDKPQEALASADVYGLAMTAAFVLYGSELPRTVFRDPQRIIQELPCTEAVKNVLRKSVEFEPGERFADAKKFCAALKTSMAQTPPTAARREGEALEKASRGISLGLGAQIALKEIASMHFVRLTGGDFWMGSPKSEKGRHNDELQHQVMVSGFEIAKTLVTQKQWRAVMGTNPSDKRYGLGDDLPVHTVTWLDAVEFMNKLSELEKVTPCYEIQGEMVIWKKNSNGYRLPTEAEWEYAARAGSERAYSFGDDTAELSRYAWYDENSDGNVHAVGSKKGNAWGLHDMAGNVWEWVWNWYAPYPASEAVIANPSGPSQGEVRVLRGGSFGDGPWYLRSAYRSWSVPTLRYGSFGFRCARGAFPALTP